MELMKPQPPEDTAKIEQLKETDSFECMGFGKPPNYIFLATVRRKAGSSQRPVCKDGVWYWK
jgi:hypothetical protein